jgi:tetratricopeptide (TPR) repeat protein
MRRNLIVRTIDRISDIRASDTQLIALFTTTVIVRNLLESVSAGLLFPAPAFIFHFPIAYVFPMLGLTVLMHLFSGYPLRKLLRLMIFAWTLTLLPPLLDLFFGTSSAIGYFPLNRSNALFFLLNFFNPAVELTGTTAGIRIEAAVGCVLAGVFTWAVAKDRRILKGFATTVVFAPVFLIFFTWPSLVYLLTVNHFPYASTVQEYFQWHAATAPHLTGSIHYTIYLIDLLPVTLILAFFYRTLSNNTWKKLAASVRHSFWEAAAPLAGALSVFIAASGVMTFADAVSVTGTLLAALLILYSRLAEGRVRTVMWIIAVSASFAVGWHTAVFALMAISVTLLPGPGWISRTLSAPILFLLASSPAGFSWGIQVIPLLVLCMLALMARKTIPGTIAGVLAVISVTLFSPDRTTSKLEYYTWMVDAVNRNGRLDYSLPIATAAAACGGDMLNLAKAELDDGDMNRARWSYEIAVIEGFDSPDAYKTGLNLAFSQGMAEEFEYLMLDLLSNPEFLEQMDVAGIIVARATRDTDTLFLQRALELNGPSPQLFHAFSAACSMNGDIERAASWARAAVSHPDAQMNHYAWAINVTALENGNYDSLYSEGIERYPGSIDLMSSRLMAPVTAGGTPDREDLLDICLSLNPASPSILRTAAVWYLHADRAEEAMEYAERAVAASREPDSALLRIACLAAVEAGDSSRVRIYAFYGSQLYPEDDFFSQLLSESPGELSSAGADTAQSE